LRWHPGAGNPCEAPEQVAVPHAQGRSAATAKIFTIFEGTSEIQRMIIGRALTGLDVR
jgi:alkylation response protein AidB-like acyl-CoA dehydrogenase